MRWSRAQPAVYGLDGQDRLRFNLPMPSVEARIDTVGKLLEMVAA